MSCELDLVFNVRNVSKVILEFLVLVELLDDGSFMYDVR